MEKKNGTHKIDLRTAKIELDENMVDKNGNPRKEALFFPGNIIRCHPELENKLKEGLSMFKEQGTIVPVPELSSDS